MDSLKAISWLSWKRNCLGNEWSIWNGVNGIHELCSEKNIILSVIHVSGSNNCTD